MKNVFGALLASVACSLLVPTHTAHAQGTAFTYQGRLDIEGQPANGTNDLTFTLYDAASGGNTVGPGSVVNDLAISNGLFSVTLDFGADPFIGAARWLEIAVRPGPSTDAYTTLSPRQPISSVPYALFAGGVNASSLVGQVTDANLSTSLSLARTFSSPGNQYSGNGANLTALNASELASGTVADGRLSPNVALRNVDNSFSTQQTISGGQLFLDNVGYGFAHRAGDRQLGTYVDAGASSIGTFTAHSLGFFVNNGFDSMVLDVNGNLGVGTTAPEGRLSVATPVGTVNLVGEDFAPALVMKGGPADGVLRLRNRLEVWPKTNLTAAGFIDVRGTDGVARIALDGGNGEITTVAVNITSDRNAKEQFKPVNAREVLAKVVGLPISEWQYKTQAEARHIGPMAQDFREAFALGRDDKHITSVDADGVALAAIQGLNEKLEEKTQEVDALKQSVAALTELVNKLAAQQNGGAR